MSKPAMVAYGVLGTAVLLLPAMAAMGSDTVSTAQTAAPRTTVTAPASPQVTVTVTAPAAAELDRRETELQQRSAQLDQREQAIAAREAAVAGAPEPEAPAPEPAPEPPPDEPADEPADGCHSSYEPCVPIASDVDCAGGSGNGPVYTGRVRVIGPDVYGLDDNGDGVGCESS